MSVNRAAAIILLVAVDPHALRKECVGVANHRGNVEVVAKIATKHSEVVTLSIKIGQNRFVRPIVIWVDDVAGFYCGHYQVMLVVMVHMNLC